MNIYKSRFFVFLALPACLVTSSWALQNRPVAQRKAFWTSVAKKLGPAVSASKGNLISAIHLVGKQVHVGLDLAYDHKPTFVNNVKSRFILSLEEADDNSDHSTSSFFVEKMKGRWNAQLLTFQKAYAPHFLQANVARLQNNDLLLGGVLYEGSNFCNGAVQSFKRSSGGWKMMSEVTTGEIESVEGADPASPPGKISIICRHFSEYFDSPHVGPMKTWLQTYGVVHDKLRLLSKMPRSTATNALDDLIGYALERDQIRARTGCKSAAVANAFLKHTQELEDKALHVEGKTTGNMDKCTQFELSPAGLTLEFERIKGKWVLARITRIPD
jgi:hypothetical protein